MNMASNDLINRRSSTSRSSSERNLRDFDAIDDHTHDNDNDNENGSENGTHRHSKEEHDMFDNIALPPWVPSHIPIEHRESQESLHRYVMLQWINECTSYHALSIAKLGDHIETFLRPHPLFHHNIPSATSSYRERGKKDKVRTSHGHGQADDADGGGVDELHPILIPSHPQRLARIRGILLYDARIEKWYNRLVKHSKEVKDSHTFFFHYTSHCQAIINGHPAFLTNPAYMSAPEMLDLSPLSEAGKKRQQDIINKMKRKYAQTYASDQLLSRSGGGSGSGGTGSGSSALPRQPSSSHRMASIATMMMSSPPRNAGLPPGLLRSGTSATNFSALTGGSSSATSSGKNRFVNAARLASSPLLRERSRESLNANDDDTILSSSPHSHRGSHSTDMDTSNFDAIGSGNGYHSLYKSAPSTYNPANSTLHSSRGSLGGSSSRPKLSEETFTAPVDVKIELQPPTPRHDDFNTIVKLTHTPRPSEIEGEHKVHESEVEAGHKQQSNVTQTHLQPPPLSHSPKPSFHRQPTTLDNLNESIENTLKSVHVTPIDKTKRELHEEQRLRGAHLAAYHEDDDDDEEEEGEEAGLAVESSVASSAGSVAKQQRDQLHVPALVTTDEHEANQTSKHDQHDEQATHRRRRSTVAAIFSRLSPTFKKRSQTETSSAATSRHPDNRKDTIASIRSEDGEHERPRKGKKSKKQRRRWTARQVRWSKGVSVILLFIYLFVAPIILTLVFYNTIVDVLQVLVPAWCMPFIILVLSYHRLKGIPGVLNLEIASYQSSLYAEAQHTSRFTRFKAAAERYLQWAWLLSQDYIYEGYHLLVTLLACGSWIWFTYYLGYHYEVDPLTGQQNLKKAHYVFLGTNSERQAFILVEYFITCSLGIDYFIRFVSSPAWRYFFVSKYSILDIACFTGVTYFSFALLDLDPNRLKLSYYNMFLLSGAVRFTRLRRSFMSLDHCHVVITRSGKTKHVYTLGPISLRPISARVVLLCVRVSLYILAMTSLIMTAEYPCISFLPEDACKPEMQQFHLVTYFVVVTLATVGYGDLYCATDVGRMVMIFVIIGAVVNVPRLLNDLNAIAEDRRRKYNELDLGGAATDPGGNPYMHPAVKTQQEQEFDDMLFMHQQPVLDNQEYVADGYGYDNQATEDGGRLKGEFTNMNGEAYEYVGRENSAMRQQRADNVIDMYDNEAGDETETTRQGAGTIRNRRLHHDDDTDKPNAFMDEARVRNFLEARERAATVADDSESDDDGALPPPAMSPTRRPTSNAIPFGSPRGPVSGTSTFTRSQTQSLTQLLSLTQGDPSLRQEFYTFCELQLLRHHHLDDIVSLCHTWKIDISNLKRSAITQTLLHILFQGEATNEDIKDRSQQLSSTTLPRDPPPIKLTEPANPNNDAAATENKQNKDTSNENGHASGEGENDMQTRSGVNDDGNQHGSASVSDSVEEGN